MDDLINLGAMPTDAILGGNGMMTPEQMNAPLLPQTIQPNPNGKMLPEPTISQSLLAAGTALLAADEQGAGIGSGIAYALGNVAALKNQVRDQARQERNDQLREYELLGRIRDRQLTEMSAAQKSATIARLKRENPELADLIDLDEKAAGKIIAEKVGGGGGPFTGNAIDAQVANLLLRGDPTSDDYLAAYNMASQPKVQIAADGSSITVTPDMSAYRLPVRGQSQPTAVPLAPGAMSSPQDPNALPSVGVPPVAAPGVPVMPQTPTYAPGSTITKTPALTPKPLTEQQSKAAYAAQRMDNAENILAGLPEDAESGMTGNVDKTARIISSIPSMGLGDSIGDGIRNVGLNPDEKRYRNAGMEWVRAKLRAESGATIGKAEEENEYKVYFPVPNDPAEVIKQKAELRKNATNNMKAMSNSTNPANEPSPTASSAPRGMLDDEEPKGDDYTKISDTEIKSLAKKHNRTVAEVKQILGIK